MDENTKVSFVITTYNRPDAVEETIESILSQNRDDFDIVVVNQVSEETRSKFEAGGKFDLDKITFYHLQEPLGVAKSRNYAYEKADGDILITLDDDVVLETRNALDIIIEEFRNNEELAVVGFKRRNSHTGEIEFPNSRYQYESVDESFEMTDFPGGNNAIRASILKEVGIFPPKFSPYSFEELDLALRILDQGYRMKYLPSVEVVHKHDTRGRITTSEEISKSLENRIRLSVRHLPWRYVLTSSLIWTIYSLYRSNLSIGPIQSAYRAIYNDKTELINQRSVLRGQTLKYIQNHSSLKSSQLYF